MIITLLSAFAAGILTLINPCVLPLLPIILASALQKGKSAPLYLVGGLILSFTLLGTFISSFGHLIGLDIETINEISAYLMIGFGLVLLLPRAQSIMNAATQPLVDRANLKLDTVDEHASSGPQSQFLVGILLGAVWSPCIGPTLGGAIALASQGENLFSVFVTMLFFSFGVASIILALSYGSRELVMQRQGALMRIMPWARPIMGIVLLLVGLAMVFKLHHYAEAYLLEVLPYWLTDLSVSI